MILTGHHTGDNKVVSLPFAICASGSSLLKDVCLSSISMHSVNISIVR